MKIVDETRELTRFYDLSVGQMCQVDWDDERASYVMKINPVRHAKYNDTFNAIELETGRVLYVSIYHFVTPIEAELHIV